MKIRKLLCSLATVSVTALSIAPLTTSCGKSYSQLVKNVVNKLIDLDKYPRCTDANQTSSPYLDPIRSWISKEVVNLGISYDKMNIDGYGNVWFDVDASTGYENYKPLILQGHMDMVVAGLSEEDQPYKPIKAVVEWDKGIVHSEEYKTSLGADNGIALAMIFSLLNDSSFKHGPLRIIFTANEDSGMMGAAFIATNYQKLLQKMGQNFDGEDIEYLINLDAENLGSVDRSCTGSRTYTFGNTKIAPDTNAAFGTHLYLDVSGLHGGHSGDLAKNYASAEKCVYEILNEFITTYPNSIQLVKHSHINEKDENIAFKRNQIVPYARIEFFTNKTANDFNQFIESKKNEWKTKYTIEDWNNVKIVVEPIASTADHHMSAADSSEFIQKVGKNSAPTNASAEAVWFGYISDGKGGALKSGNISPVKVEYDVGSQKYIAQATSQVRCQTNEALQDIDNYYDNFTILSGATSTTSYYPAWPYIEGRENKMIEYAVEGYKKNGITATPTDGSGGIEPTWWQQCNSKLQIASIGPTITDPHSTNETLHLDGLQQVIDTVKYICSQIKK